MEARRSVQGGLRWAQVSVMVRVRAVITVPIGYRLPIADVDLPIGLLGFGGGTANAKQGQEDKSQIKGNGVNVPPVSQGPDQGHGVHGPVETEPVGAQQQPGVGGGQVEESERPRQEVRRVGRGVVGIGEVWRLVAHPVEASRQQRRPPGNQRAQTQQGAGVLFLEEGRGGKKRRLSNRKKNTAKSTCECKGALPQKATVFCLRGRTFVFVFKKRPHQYLSGYSRSELNRGNQRRRNMFVVTGLGQRSSVFECLISKYFSPLSERKLCTTISGMFLVAGPGTQTALMYSYTAFRWHSW